MAIPQEVKPPSIGLRPIVYDGADRLGSDGQEAEYIELRPSWASSTAAQDVRRSNGEYGATVGDRIETTRLCIRARARITELHPLREHHTGGGM